MKQINFAQQIERLKNSTYQLPPDRVYITIPNARNVLARGIKHFCNDKAVWLSQYDRVAEWLSNNQGKGLMLAGQCGLGKSLIAVKILPLLLSFYCRKIINCYTAQQLNTLLDAAIQNHIICIDDIGTESISNIYGNKRIPFAELVDEAERKGKLLVITTNLDDQHLIAKYGDRTFDRLKAIVKKITFTGQSLRA